MDIQKIEKQLWVAADEQLSNISLQLRKIEE